MQIAPFRSSVCTFIEVLFFPSYVIFACEGKKNLSFSLLLRPQSINRYHSFYSIHLNAYKNGHFSSRYVFIMSPIISQLPIAVIQITSFSVFVYPRHCPFFDAEERASAKVLDDLFIQLG